MPLASSSNTGASIATAHVATKCGGSSTRRATGAASSRGSRGSPRLGQENRMANIFEARRALVARILEGEGRASPALRRAAFDNAGLAEPLATLVEKVAKRANAVSDQDITAVRAAGLNEDQIFELVVCGAVGQAMRQHENALAALDVAAG